MFVIMTDFIFEKVLPIMALLSLLLLGLILFGLFWEILTTQGRQTFITLSKSDWECSYIEKRTYAGYNSFIPISTGKSFIMTPINHPSRTTSECVEYKRKDFYKY